MVIAVKLSQNSVITDVITLMGFYLQLSYCLKSYMIEIYEWYIDLSDLIVDLL